MTYEDVIEIESAKERFMGNYAMFTTYLFRFAEGELMEKLKKALATGSVQESFEAAHDMKGVTLNLSLTLLEEPMVAFVEVLRAGAMPDEGDWNTLAAAYELTLDWIEKLKAEGRQLF